MIRFCTVRVRVRKSYLSLRRTNTYGFVRVCGLWQEPVIQLMQMSGHSVRIESAEEQADRCNHSYARQNHCPSLDKHTTPTPETFGCIVTLLILHQTVHRTPNQNRTQLERPLTVQKRTKSYIDPRHRQKLAYKTVHPGNHYPYESVQNRTS